jgi:hypothetical protein
LADQKWATVTTRRKILIDQVMPYEFIRFTENPRLFIQQQFWEN